MVVKLKRKGKLFFLKDRGRTAPLTKQSYLNAIQDNIKAVESTGDHTLLPYEELLEILKGLCSDELCRTAERSDDGDVS